MKNKDQMWIWLVVIAFVFYFWRKNRFARTQKCSELWAGLCTECRQLFFEKMNDIDNDPSLLALVQSEADDNDMTLYNAKVSHSAKYLKGLGRVNDTEEQEIILCESDPQNTLRIA
tara:strand:- start:803 stop:1150 length:348 start_codon:yes stop_codon:yes gene_type:complete